MRLRWMDVKTAFLGPNATRLRCILPFEWTISRSLCVGGHYACWRCKGYARAARHPPPRDTHAADVRTITEGEVPGCAMEHQQVLTAPLPIQV